MPRTRDSRLRVLFFILFSGDAGAEKNKKFSLFFLGCCCLVKEKILLISRSFGVERILSFVFVFQHHSLVFFFISNFHLIDHLRRRRRGREMEQLESGGGAAVHSIPKGNLFSGGLTVDDWRRVVRV